MADLTIERDVVIDAPIDVVWRTITEPDQIVRWFADRVELDDLQPGTCGALVFRADADDPLRAAVVVEAIEEPTRFAFRWGHAANETATPHNSVLVEFTLTAEAVERTRLSVCETGLAANDWPSDGKQHYADDHNDGWARHLGRLAALFGA
jgi:uncharacterized protein YndB with AHSA1/START domain